MSIRETLFADRAFYKNLFRIGLPVALQNLLGTTASMIDTVMLGTQGELAVAAVGICAQFSSLLFAAYFGFASGGMMFFSQFHGAKDEKGILKSYGLTLSCMLVVGLLFGLVSIIAPNFILGIYTDKESIQQVALPYLRIVGFSFPLQVISMAMSSLLRSTEKVKVPLYASIAALSTNVFLNWVLIFGVFGLPKMGVSGAAVATLAASIVNVLVLFIYCLRDPNSLVLRVKEQFGWTMGFARRYFLKCLPIICNEMLYGVGQMLINIVIGRQDEAGIAAMAAFRVIEGLIYAFFGGLANASSVMVGKQVGAGLHQEAYRDAKRFAFLCPMITFVICLCILPVRGPLLSMFGLGETALSYGMVMLLIYTVAATVRTCNYMVNNVARAGGEPVFGTVVEIGGLFLVAVPAIFVTGMWLKLPFLMVFSVMYSDEIIKFFVGLWYLRSGRWVKPVTTEGVATIEAFRATLPGKRRAISRTGN